MSKTRIALLAVSLAIAACSSPQPRDYVFRAEDISPIPKMVKLREEDQRRERLAKEATPATWAIGSTWRFTELDKRGKIVRTSVVRVTDKPVHSCMGGNWRQLEVIEGDPKQLRVPAYEREGRVLTVMLSNDMCDSYPMYIGEFVGDAFEGQFTWTGLGRSEEHGAVRGEQVSLASR